MVVTANPSSTGLILRRASSNGLTPHIAAAGISAQGKALRKIQHIKKLHYTPKRIE